MIAVCMSSCVRGCIRGLEPCFQEEEEGLVHQDSSPDHREETHVPDERMDGLEMAGTEEREV